MALPRWRWHAAIGFLVVAMLAIYALLRWASPAGPLLGLERLAVQLFLVYIGVFIAFAAAWMSLALRLRRWWCSVLLAYPLGFLACGAFFLANLLWAGDTPQLAQWRVFLPEFARFLWDGVNSVWPIFYPAVALGALALDRLLTGPAD